MIKVSLPNRQILSDINTIVYIKFFNDSDTSCWNVYFELNLPPTDVFISKGYKFQTEYFRAHETIEHKVHLRAEKPGEFLLSTRRFHFCDATDKVQNLFWQEMITAVANENPSHVHRVNRTRTEVEDLFWEADTSKPNLSNNQASESLLGKLYDNLTRAYNLDELRALCLKLEINYDMLDGQNLGTKSTSLLLHCQRRGKIGQLTAICKVERPNENWDFDEA